MRYLTETRKCSERRACRLVCLPRQTARYIARKREGEAALVERLQEIGEKHRRFGYRRAHALVRREGQKVNHKRVHRLWKREGLSVKRRIKKRRLVEPKQERPTSAEYPNHVWTVDFVQNQTISGRKLRMLTVTDEFTRESLGIEVGLSLTSEKVVGVLAPIFTKRGAPGHLRSDNGPEFIALILRGFLHRSGVKTAYIEPGSPWHTQLHCGGATHNFIVVVQNGFAESFHSRFRDEFLNGEVSHMRSMWAGEVFLPQKDAQVRVETWRRWYNTERPHSSLGYKTPNEFADQCRECSQKVAKTNTPIGT